MQEQNKGFRLSGQGLAAAVIVVAVAGLTAIYVMESGSGNDGGSGGEPVAAAEVECEGSAEVAARLEGLNTGEVAAFQIASAPAPIGKLTFQDKDGAANSLSDWRGKTVLLNLWATWCAPCREEMPALDALEKEMGGENFAVVPVSVDLGEPDKPKAFYAETGVASLPFFHDGTMGVFNELKKRNLAIGMPTSILVDEKGCTLGSLSGPAAWASPDAKALIGAAINAAKAGS